MKVPGAERVSSTKIKLQLLHVAGTLHLHNNERRRRHTSGSVACCQPAAVVWYHTTSGSFRITIILLSSSHPRARLLSSFPRKNNLLWLAKLSLLLGIIISLTQHPHWHLRTLPQSPPAPAGLISHQTIPNWQYLNTQHHRNTATTTHATRKDFLLL